MTAPTNWILPDDPGRAADWLGAALRSAARTARACGLTVDCTASTLDDDPARPINPFRALTLALGLEVGRMSGLILELAGDPEGRRVAAAGAWQVFHGARDRAWGDRVRRSAGCPFYAAGRALADDLAAIGAGAAPARPLTEE